jgi:MoxR-like ATPase
VSELPVDAPKSPLPGRYSRPVTPDELRRGLAAESYFADEALATVLRVALTLGRPLLLEGEPGVGKTEVAKALAALRGSRLIRLQCYEGIDVAHALYDWSYARQMLSVRMLEAADAARPEAVDELFGRAFLVRRPLLDAIENEDAVAPVLLIDEIDRADEEFEAFLLELLSDFQVTVPELGTITARVRPVAILTSNRTRELHDALRRRCLYHWLGHPDPRLEMQIVRARVPHAPDPLVREATAFVGALRERDLVKAPGVAETLDWVAALCSLDVAQLAPTVVGTTLGALLKHRDDLALVRGDDLGAAVAGARETAAGWRAVG